MVSKRKADDNLTGTRHPAARRDPTAGDDLAGTSANNTGPTANAAGDGIAEISPAMAWLLEVTSGYARGSPQFDGAARGAGGGSGYRGLSQSHGRAPQMPSQGMLRPPQIPSQGMLRPPVGNPAGGRPPVTNQYHAPTGNGSLSGQSQNHAPTGNGSLSGQSQSQNHAAGHRQRGTGQPRGHSGSDGTSSTISCASAPGARVPVSPLARDGYNNFVTSNMLPQHTEIRYVPPRPVPSYGGATQGQGIAIGHQPQLEPRLRQPSSAAPAGVAVGPRTWGPSAQWCRLCPAPATRVYCSAPFCEVCYSRLFAADDVPQQHAQAGGYAPRGAVPASEQQYRAAAIRPSSSSSSSSSVGSGPICQACGHLVRTRNRMCRSCHRGGPPPPGLG